MLQRVVLVTGGGSGLGRAAAAHLVAKNHRVVIADLNADAGKDAAAALGEAAVFHQTDVQSEEQVNGALDMAEQTFGEPIGAAVNCAGIGSGMLTLNRKHEPHDLGAFAKVLNVNVLGSFNVARLSARRMAVREVAAGSDRGVFINTASIAAFDGQRGQAAYAASKGAIVGMTLPIARDLAGFGIRCMTIAPGTFDTPLMASVKEEIKQALAASVPFPKRLGHPDEFGALVGHIIDNKYLNGEVIRIDGAVRMT
jgi:3-hydroxyacyl-CoA dehydrogenase/3-hydroxy-2-methylbutyryl-CoA dehydrogenase